MGPGGVEAVSGAPESFFIVSNLFPPIFPGLIGLRPTPDSRAFRRPLRAAQLPFGAPSPGRSALPGPRSRGACCLRLARLLLGEAILDFGPWRVPVGHGASRGGGPICAAQDLAKRME